MEFKYYFPELDNLGNYKQINYWICCYITILFIRQFSLKKHFISQNFTSIPDLSDNLIKLTNYFDLIIFFKNCLKSIQSNSDLLNALDFQKLVSENTVDFEKFLYDLSKKVKLKISEIQHNAVLSDEKKELFNQSSNKIISETFDLYKEIFNKEIISEIEIGSHLKLVISGEKTIISKSAFVSNDVPHLNFDWILAEAISNQKIKRYIPNAFSIARTNRYLFNTQNVIYAISKLIENNSKAIIVGVNVNSFLIQNLNSSKFGSRIKYIPAADFDYQDTLFVLRESDLPYILFNKFEEDENLKCINSDYNIYASVIDINLPKNHQYKKEWNIQDDSNKDNYKVQIEIKFEANLYWKKEREIVQINVVSEYREQGIENDLNELKPLKN